MALACVGLAFALLTPESASAQTDTGGFASVVVSALSIDEDATTSIAATIGYRLNPILSLGAEFTYVPTFRPAAPDVLLFPSPVTTMFGPGGLTVSPQVSTSLEGGDGVVTLFTGNVRLSIPTGSRLQPYLAAGAGAGHVRDELRLTVSFSRFPDVFPLPGSFPTGPLFSEIVFPTPSVLFPARSETIARSTTGFAMTFGGGVSVMMTERWSIDADARYLGIMGRRDINTGRYGGGVTYRFGL